MNRVRTFLSRWVFLLVFVFAVAPPSISAADLSGYLDYQGLTDALRDLAGPNPNLVRVTEIGKSAGGRSLWVVEVANADGAVKPADRPALFVAANFEGDQLVGSQLALESIRRLVEGYASDAAVKQVLDNYVVYVLPRANPDGAEAMFSPVKAGGNANSRPFDDDNDGRIDEDGPEDLNGDGFISVMRAKDPEGEYMIHPEDARLLKKADPARGEAGEYKVYWEGVDNDGDGFINEDPPGGVDLNRNFQHRYPYYQVGAGPHMVSEPEAKAILDWVLDHRNIAIVLTYGESDNLVTPPDSKGKLGPESMVDLMQFASESVAGAGNVGMVEIESRGSFRFFGGFRNQANQRGQDRPRRPTRRPEVDVNADDVPYFKTVSDRYKEITGLEKTPEVRTPAGAFFEYGYFQYGVLSLSTPGWGPAKPAADAGEGGKNAASEEGERAQRGGPGGRRPGGGGPPSRSGPASGGRGGEEAGVAKFDLEWIRWMDEQKIDAFLPWTEIDHPEKGKVEVGGFNPIAVSNPPGDRLEELGEKQFQFLCYLATLFPKVAVAKSSVVNLGGGLFRIRAEIENSGFLPTALAHGVVSRSVKPTMVQLGIDPESLVSGDAKTSFFQALSPTGAHQKYDWIVRGESGSEVTIRVVSQKGGSQTVTLTLQ